MVDGTDVFGDLACGGQVGRTLQTHGERVQLRPPGGIAAAAFDASVGELLGYGRDDRRIESARKQHAVRHVGHQLPADGLLECRAELGDVGLVVLHGVVVEPVAAVPAHHPTLLRRPVVARQEGLDRRADPFESLQLRGDVELFVAVPADVERDDADRVAGDQILVVFDVVEGEGEDAADLFEHPEPHLAVEGQDHLAVGTGHEVVLRGQFGADLAVVVDFAVDGQHELSVTTVQGLPARLRVDDREAFVRQNRPRSAVDSRPVGTAVANLFRHFQHLGAQRIRLLPDVEQSNESTHDKLSVLSVWLIAISCFRGGVCGRRRRLATFRFRAFRAAPR